jgi:2',3'-cyclic-nucleotide 2'-phosphodiesterase (5'-nucleotidase family)
LYIRKIFGEDIFFKLAVENFNLMKGTLYVLAAFISLSACKTKFQVESTKQTEYILSDSLAKDVDTTVLTFIHPYKEKMEGEMNTVIAESEVAMERGTPESRLGNFVADACMSEATKVYYPIDGLKADFLILNNGGLRRSLPAGKITRGDVFELMPFENELIVLTLDGKLVKKIFNFIASKNGAPVSGVRFFISNQEALDIRINGQPLDTMKTYKMITSDYLANGGDNFGMLKDVPRESLNLKVRDAIMNYLMEAGKEEKKITVNTDGRIQNAK